MKITYNDKKEYVLTSDEDIFLGSLKFEKWSYSKAQITTQFGEFYDIASKGFWGTSMVISKSDKEFAELKMNWKGQIVIDMSENGEGIDYLIKSNSMWKSQYAVYNQHEKELLIFTADYKWSKGAYNFKIDVNPDFADQMGETFVLIATYGILYLMMMTAAAAAS